MTDWRRVGADLARLVEERDEARAEVARLRARLAQVEAAGLLGMSIGQKDRNGRPVHYGDVLTFDEREWGEPGYTFEARLEDGAIPHYGDMPSWCEIVQAAPRPPEPNPERGPSWDQAPEDLRALVPDDLDPGEEGLMRGGAGAERLVLVDVVCLECGSTTKARASHPGVRCGYCGEWVTMEDAAQPPPAGPSPERMLALMRHGPKRGGRG